MDGNGKGKEKETTNLDEVLKQAYCTLGEMPPKPITRAEFFMGVAELMRKRSKDEELKVGCCIVDSATRSIVATGYNGFVMGQENDAALWEDRDEETDPDSCKDYLLHAEQNACHFAPKANLSGTIVYVTCFPCENCATLLLQKRVGMVVSNITRKKYEASEKYFKMAYRGQRKAEEEIRSYVISFADANHNDQNTKTPEVFLRISRVHESLLQTNWDYLWMNVAALAAQRSDDDNDRAGAVVVKKHRILGYGFSGIAQAFRHLHPDLEEEERKLLITVTAITNALVYVPEVKGCTVYCTRLPNLEEMKAMIQRRVKRVRYLGPVDVTDSSVQKTLKLAMQFPIALSPMRLKDGATYLEFAPLISTSAFGDKEVLEEYPPRTTTPTAENMQQEAPSSTDENAIKLPPSDSTGKKRYHAWGQQTPLRITSSFRESSASPGAQPDFDSYAETNELG